MWIHRHYVYGHLDEYLLRVKTTNPHSFISKIKNKSAGAIGTFCIKSVSQAFHP